MQRARDVRVVIEFRLKNRRPHSRARGKMNYGINFLAIEQTVDRSAVAQIDLVDRYILRESSHIGSLDLRIVKVVEIVENRDFMPGREEFLDEVRADETGAARDQDPHRATVKMKPGPGKRRTAVNSARGAQAGNPNSTRGD